ncbi:hypothetical protein [Methylophaga muralis]|uniref:Uncharacterized protein n=1 Tax=Methylophaga muralis TaxID=291169 RepID=A0A1E3GN24_9GAMM|nr:hypothetical protein [Methylophaga muralis]ODN65440.1 hypothetical protein A9E74_02769 [Methylophaga muralis]
MEKYERLLKMAASVVAITVPCILLSGFSYHLGRIFTFGLSYELINKDMSDVLVESWYIGVVAIAWLLSKWTYWLGFFVFFSHYWADFFFLCTLCKKKVAKIGYLKK